MIINYLKNLDYFLIIAGIAMILYFKKPIYKFFAYEKVRAKCIEIEHYRIGGNSLYKVTFQFVYYGREYVVTDDDHIARKLKVNKDYSVYVNHYNPYDIVSRQRVIESMIFCILGVLGVCISLYDGLS